MATIIPVRVDVPEAPPAPSRRRRGRGGRTSSAGPLTYVLLILTSLVSIFPLYWTLVAGSHTNNEIASTPPPFLPSADLFENFALALEQAPIGKAIVNSVIVASCVTIGTVLCCTLAGFAFAKLKFRGNGFLLALVIGTMMVPTQLAIIPLFILIAKLQWVNELQAVVLPTLVTAFGVFFMRQYLVDAVPDELIEAARVDGCNMFRTFLTVAVPVARPAMAILWLFTFMMVWTDFFWPLIVLPADNPTVQVALNQLQSGYFKDYALVLAGTSLATIPLLVLFVVTGKQFVAGIMQGAVKG
jgi:cellobiose transport system permease protein